jgi:two-component sensor histidine kinase
VQVRTDREAIDELQRVEAALKASIEEKDTMLKEIHHRVKNNLQMVSSLLTLQMDQMPDASTREHLADSIRRVRSMALIHQHLYGSASLERVDLGSYARSLAEALRVTLAPRARVRVDVAAVEAPVDRAVPLCLLLNELLTNAFKYGAEPTQPAPDWDVRVLIEEVASPRGLRVVVQDRGPGLPEGFRLQGHASLGLQLVTTLARQIRGTVSARNDEGACFEVVFPW